MPTNDTPYMDDLEQESNGLRLACINPSISSLAWVC